MSCENRVHETEVGTTVQKNFEIVTKEYVVDCLREANRDISVQQSVAAPGHREAAFNMYCHMFLAGYAGDTI